MPAHESAAALAFQFILVDVPVEVIVGVAPPLDPSSLRGERCGQGEKSLVEVAIDDGLLRRGMDGAGGTGLGAPAELGIAGMLFFEPPMDVAEVAKLLQGAAGQKVVNNVQHGQASFAAFACRAMR